MPYSMSNSWLEEDGNKEAKACLDKRLSVDERLRTFIFLFPFFSQRFSMTLNFFEFSVIKILQHTNRK